MICPRCGKETRGIKLNGKVFCTFCGEIVKDPTEILEESYTSAPKPELGLTKKKENPEPQIIVPESIEQQRTDEEAKLLEAEEEVLEMIAKKPSKKPIKIKDLSIKKHERTRADHEGFRLVEGEPDPINEPELSPPHDDLIKGESTTSQAPKSVTNKDKEPGNTHYTLMDKKHRDELKEKSQKRQDVFSLFLKQTAHAISDKKIPTKKKRKNKSKSRHLVIWISVAIMVITIGVSSLAYYVNTYITNVTQITSRLESNPSFVYQKPQNVPAGYKLSYLSRSGDDFVEYFYTFDGDRNRYFKVRIEPTEIRPTDLQTKIISTLGVEYHSTKVETTEFWQTNDNQIFVQKDGVIYIYRHSGEFSDELFMDVAQEMLL